MKCIISCEHASNQVPPSFTHLFKGKEKVLSSHQAHDHGTADLAGRLAKRFKTPAYLGSISRLLIDLNRSPSNRKSLYSAYSRKLQQNDRKLLLNKYYLPYREKVEGAISGIIGKGQPVLHISVHSFAPAINGKVRKADIGLLYDPTRNIEKYICNFLVELLKKKVAPLQVRRNYPYQGKADGFTSFLRKKYSAKLYAGIEIEINQALLSANDIKKKKTEDVLTKGIETILKLQNFLEVKDLL
ncbi:MAG: N-formylglutamate amidohydrolase [Desulfobulbaceae bacterium]|nr:N-formylglutamate amidohydrolase [Desulfobulbaceae bacterium]